MADFSVTQSVTLPRHPLPILSLGMGGIVHDSHYPAYQKAGFEVIGGYDLSMERAQNTQRKFGFPVNIYSSLDEAIQNSPSDAVFDVAVPGSAILDVLKQLPDHRAILIQKPMGETLDEARAILQLCQEKHLTAAINFQMRYTPAIIAARSMIDSGMIGDVNDMEVRMQVHMPWHLWSFLKTSPRLEILYHSIHYIDLLRSFLGDPAAVYAKTLKHPINPDLAATRSTIIMDYGDAVRANILTNHGHIYGIDKQQSYVKWEGSKGAIQVRVGVNMDYPKGVPDLFEYILLDDDSPAWKTLPIEGTWFPDAFIGTMASLMCYVQGETNLLPTSVEDAITTMAVVEAAYQSSSGGGIAIPAI